MKIYLFLFSLIFTQLTKAQEISQPELKLRKAAISFLSFDPYSNQLDKTIDSLLQSPDFTLDTLINRSDTSLFYLRGYCKGFNPFKMQLDSVKIIIAEKKRVDRVTKIARDTLLYFQTEGSIINTATNSYIQTTFSDIHKSVSGYFSKRIYFKEKKKKAWISEAYDYYIESNTNRVANMTWLRRDQNLTTITFSFITRLQ
jgi:hypothetical protein